MINNQEIELLKALNKSLENRIESLEKINEVQATYIKELEAKLRENKK